MRSPARSPPCLESDSHTRDLRDAANAGANAKKGARHCARALGAGRRPVWHLLGKHGAVNCAGIVLTQRVLGKQGVHDLASFTKVVQLNLSST